MPIITSPTVVITDDGNINANNGVIGIHNLLTEGTVTADSADANFPVINLANESTAEEWHATSNAAQFVTINTSGYGDVIDYMGIAAHNLGSQKIPVSVEANSGAGYVEIIAPVMMADDGPIMFRWTPAMYTGVRLKINAGGLAAANIAIIYVGKLLSLQRRTYVGITPPPDGYQQEATNGMSESGNFLGRIIVGASTQYNLPLSNLTAAWFRQYFRPFLVLARTKCFFHAWRPQTYPTEVGFVWLTTMPVPTNDLSNGMMKVSLSLRGIT